MIPEELRRLNKFKISCALFLLLLVLLSAAAFPVNARSHANPGSSAVSSYGPAVDSSVASAQGQDYNYSTEQFQGFMDYHVNLGNLSYKPSAILYDPFTTEYYVALGNLQMLLVMNSTSNLETGEVTVGASPQGMAYDPVNHFVYVANLGSDNVSVINTASEVIASVSVGKAPENIAFDPQNSCIYVVDSGSNTVSVIDPATNTVTGTVHAGTSPWGVAYDPANTCIYVTNSGSDSVTIIRSNNSIAAVTPVGHIPEGIAFDPANGNMYVANSGRNPAPYYIDYLSVLNSTSLGTVSRVSLNFSPANAQTIAYDPMNRCMYVTLTGDNSVYAINAVTDKLIKEIFYGAPWDAWSELSGITFNPVNGLVYVLSSAQHSIGLISTVLYPVIFQESGVSPARTWNIQIGQSYNLSQSADIVFMKHNGEYSYTIGNSSWFYTANYTGKVDVSNGTAYVNLTFAPLYTIEFLEHGLPANTKWHVMMYGQDLNRTGTMIGFNVPEGTYHYTTGTYSGTYNATNSSGNITTSGNITMVQISFMPGNAALAQGTLEPWILDLISGSITAAVATALLLLAFLLRWRRK